MPKKTILLLTHIYDAILRMSYFSVLWEFSIIIMIPKPGTPPDSSESYVPISLLPLFSKMFERIILKRILTIIEASIPNTQFGFRHNHSTIHQDHRLVDKISYNLEKKNLFAQLPSLMCHKHLTDNRIKAFYSNSNPFFYHTIFYYLSLI